MHVVMKGEEPQARRMRTLQSLRSAGVYGAAHQVYGAVVPGVRFFRARTGAQIAYTVEGSGPPLIICPAWFGHLEAATALSGYAAYDEVVTARHTVIRYDRWGTGLSDRDRDDYGLQSDAHVLLDLIDHLALRRLALFGPSHGGSVAMIVAAAVPRRVSHLVLYGTGARPKELVDASTWQPLRSLMQANWWAATRTIAALSTTGCEDTDVTAFATYMTASVTAEAAVALYDTAVALGSVCVVSDLRVPTLVLSRWGDPYVTPERARALAGDVPGAQLEMLPGQAHPYTLGDSRLVAERMVAFTAASERSDWSAPLTEREAEVVGLVAEGRSNSAVADRLHLSVRTVERHLLNSYTKLGVHGRHEAVALVLAHGGAPEPAPA